jgi:hypothetical protein
MQNIVYRINTLLTTLLRRVPLGTNLGLLSLMWALLSGRLLQSRGALFPALADLGLSDAAVRRASAALTYGRFQMADLLHDWNQLVLQEGQFHPHSHGGFRPVPVDLVGFFRPKLVDCTTKHYTSQAGKALPALAFGMVGATGSVGEARLCLPRLLVEADPNDHSEADHQKRTVIRAAQTRAHNEALIFDAGFPLKELLSVQDLVFVVRGPKNFTARRNFLPAYPGKGRPADSGDVVRPLARTYNGKTIPATPPDAVLEWTEGEHTIQALLFTDLVASDAKPGSPSFRCVVIIDPRYREPLVLVTNLPVSVSEQEVRGLYRDRWPVEQMPLAAKQMLGAARSFVFAPDSRTRLPQLALLAGNVLSYVAATSAPVATGFWDRQCRPTCGRLRRVLSRLHFSDLALEAVEEGLGRQVRKKASVTEHLPKGVEAHRRTKTVLEPLTARLAA